jgi:ubiquinone/menaquinone biosynthesis C-methylase UbiE
MTPSTHWQLAREAAERYDAILIPTILGPAARALVDWAQPRRGMAVLDVGCGTGAAARHAAERVGASGRVVGVDLNPAMLAVARCLPPAPGAPIEWIEGDASELFAENGTFDLTLCAQVLQFVSDRKGALSEMHRVLKADGRACLSAWCALEENPYSEALVECMSRYIGDEAAQALAAAFALGNTEEIRRLLVQAGFTKTAVTRVELDLELPELTEFVPRHIAATPMAAAFDAADPTIRQAIVRDVAHRLGSYGDGSGVRMPFRTHFAMGWKEG